MSLDARSRYLTGGDLRTEVVGDSLPLPDATDPFKLAAKLKPRWYEKPKATAQAAAIDQTIPTRTDLLRKSVPERKRVTTYGTIASPMNSAGGPAIMPWYPGMPYSQMNPPVVTGSRWEDEPFVGPPQNSAFVADPDRQARAQVQALGQQQQREGGGDLTMQQLMLILAMMRQGQGQEQERYPSQAPMSTSPGVGIGSRG